MFAAEIERRAATAPPESATPRYADPKAYSAIRKPVESACALLHDPAFEIFWETVDLRIQMGRSPGPRVDLRDCRARLAEIQSLLGAVLASESEQPPRAGRRVDHRFDEALQVVLLAWHRSGGRFASGENSRFVRAACIALPVVAGVPVVHGVRAMVRRVAREWNMPGAMLRELE
jgi:hypothetical protein